MGNCSTFNTSDSAIIHRILGKKWLSKDFTICMEIISSNHEVQFDYDAI